MTNSERATSLLRAGACTGAALFAFGCEPAPGVVDGADWPVQWALPGRLAEISGLTLTPDGRLYAHDDERAVIYRLDYRDGRIASTFSLGHPPLTGDFEGIAWWEDRFYLVTSGGELYVFAEGDDGTAVRYDRHDTGVGRHCEVEGLDADAATKRLLLVCKTMHKKKAQPAVFAWSPATGELDEAPVVIDIADEAARFRGGQFNPSAIAVLPAGRNWLVLGARQRAWARVAPDGQVIAAGILEFADRHPQPEGLAVAADGTVFIADEGRGGRSRLSVYAPGQAY